MSQADWDWYVRTFIWGMIVGLLWEMCCGPAVWTVADKDDV